MTQVTESPMRHSSIRADIAVLPGWGERTYLEGCCFVTAAVIHLPSHERDLRIGR